MKKSMLIAALVAVGIFALPAGSFGAATVSDVLIASQVGPFPVDDTCAGAGVVVILSGTDTITGQTVETETGFHFAGTDTFVYRMDFPDGSYEAGSQSEHITFNANSLQDVVTITGALLARAPIYDANGNVIGFERFNNIFHTTIIGGTAVVDFSKGFLSCR
jgi:hypothetical protein